MISFNFHSNNVDYVINFSKKKGYVILIICSNCHFINSEEDHKLQTMDSKRSAN